MQQTEKEIIGFIWYLFITLAFIRLLYVGDYISAVLLLIGAWILRWVVIVIGALLLRLL